MAAATITITDTDEGKVHVCIDFGEGLDEGSAAHHLAVVAHAAIVDYLEDDEQ